MDQDLKQVYEIEENRQTARIISTLIWAAWIVFLFVIITGLYQNDWILIGITLAGCALLVVPFTLLRRGQLRISSLIIILIMFTTITAIATVGQGIRDLAVIGFPVVFIFAGLTLDRALFRLCVGLALAAISWLALGEIFGWYVTKPFEGEAETWFYLTGTSIILVVAALAVDQLTTNMRRNLELAHLEIRQRKQADSALRESETRYKSLFENNLAVMLIIDPDDAAIVDANPAACAYYGWNRETLLKMRIHDINTLDPEAVRLEMGLANTEKRNHFYFKHRRADGSIRDVEVYSGPLVLMGKRLIYSMIIDITERALVEAHNRIIGELQGFLLRPYQLEDVYAHVSEKVSQLIGDGITATSILDEKQRTLRMISYHGADIPFEKLLSILGFDPIQKEYSLDNMPEEDLGRFRSGRLEVLEGGLYALMIYMVPKPACLLIEKLLHIQKVYTMEFIHNEEPMGSLIILARSDITPHIATIEQIVNLATLAIERKRAEMELENSEKRFQALIEHGRDNISLLKADGKLVWESPSADSMLGYAPNQFVGNNIFDLVHPNDQEWTRGMYGEVLQAPGNIQAGELRLLHADGTWRWIECSAVNLLNEPSVQAIVLNYREITQRKQAEEALREKEVQYRNLADSGTALIWSSGIDKLRFYFNKPWLQFTGRTPGHELGNGWAEGVHPDDFDRCQKTYADAFDKHEAFEMEYRLRHVSGEYRWIQDLGTPNFNSNNEFVGYIGHCFDITDRKRVEDQLRHQGTHDGLTGIYNRSFFEEELARLERGRDFPISVIMADIDGLKLINDRLGHAVGDQLLQQAVGVLNSVFRAGDVLARIGGDEFAALLPATDSAAAEQIILRIKSRLLEHNAQLSNLTVQLSLGAATAERDNLTGIFTLADQRMYADKTARKLRVSQKSG